MLLMQHVTYDRFSFLTYETEFVLFLAVLENSVLPIRLRQLTGNAKSDTEILNFRSDVTYALPRKILNGVRKRSLCA